MIVYDCHGLQNHMLAKSWVTLEIEKAGERESEQEEHSTEDRYSTLCWQLDRVEHQTTRILLCGTLLDIIIAWISPH